MNNMKDRRYIMEWVEVKIKVQPETEELITGILYAMGVQGLRIEDPRDVSSLEQRKEDWDYIDIDKVGLNLDGIYINAYFSEEDSPQDKIDFLEKEFLNNEFIDPDKHEIITKKVYEKDWAESWKKYYKPTRIGKNIVIKPSWESYEPKDEDLVIELDPGMAFGTGTHETTSMCTEALEAYLKPGDRVFDIGTGSGILSIVAGKLGAKEILSRDLDPAAVKVARENVEHNGLKDTIDVQQGNLLDGIEGRADILVANIIADIIIHMSKDVPSYLKEGGIFITSGIILDKVKDVQDALLENNFEILETNKMQEWACIIGRLK